MERGSILICMLGTSHRGFQAIEYDSHSARLPKTYPSLATPSFQIEQPISGLKPHHISKLASILNAEVQKLKGTESVFQVSSPVSRLGPVALSECRILSGPITFRIYPAHIPCSILRPYGPELDEGCFMRYVWSIRLLQSSTESCVVRHSSVIFPLFKRQNRRAEAR